MTNYLWRFKLLKYLLVIGLVLISSGCDKGSASNGSDMTNDLDVLIEDDTGLEDNDLSQTDIDEESQDFDEVLADTDEVDQDIVEVKEMSVQIKASSETITENGTVDLSCEIMDGFPPYTFKWTFDSVAEDSVEESPTEILFEEPGDYTMTVEVEDSQGQKETATMVIKVEGIEGNFNCYYGNMHSHSGVSDGEGTPDEVMNWAKFVEEIDFYIMTDHSEQIFGDEFDLIKQNTDFYTENGKFVAMRGFEWSHPLNGHICIYLTDDYTAAYNALWINFIYDWIDERNALAQFNHPGREDGVFNDLKFEAYVDDNMFAIETGNKSTGNNDGEFLSYYSDALDNGWHVAPSSNQDNHSLSLTSHRTVFVGEELSQAGLIDAMYSRRLYSSDDPDIKVFFKSGDNWMGSHMTIVDNKIDFSIKVEDNESILSLQLIGNKEQVLAELIPEEGVTSLKWFPEITVDTNTYVFLKVTSEDTLDDDGPEQIAVTAPFWLFH